MRTAFFRSQIYGFITVCLWSSAYVFTKVALEYFSVASLAFLRCLVASVCFCLIIAVKKGAVFPSRIAIASFLFCGASGFAVYTLVFNQGVVTLTPATSCILIATSPIMTALLARIRYSEKISGIGWIAIGLAFGGVATMMLWDGTFALSGGMVWTLAAALCISTYNIAQRGLARNYSALQITAFSFFAATALLSPFTVEALSQIRNAPMHMGYLVLFLGCFPSAAAYLCWAKALSLAPKTSMVTNFMFLTPLLTVLLDLAVTHRWPDAGTFAGGGIIMASLVLFAFSQKKRSAAIAQDLDERPKTP